MALDTGKLVLAAALLCGGEEVPPRVELRSEGLRVAVSDNRAWGRHRAGYSGVAELSHRDSALLFVPEVSGLNFEHILSGDSASYGWDIFEPRRAPMDLVRTGPRRAELRQARTGRWPLKTTISYELKEDEALDWEVRCVPLEDAWKKHGTIGLFFASYIDQPEDGAIHFIGRSRPGKGDSRRRWIRHLPARHGESACHRPAGSDWDPPLDPGLPIPLAAGLSDLEYLHPFYYGVTRGKALIFLFEEPREGGELRFAQSPTGGGARNPAWDFLYWKRGYRVGEEFAFRGRLLVREFKGREDVVRAYESWSGRKVEPAD